MRWWILSLLFLCAGCGNLREKKVLNLARDPSWYPVNLYGKEMNLLGFTNELLEKLAERSGYRIRLYSISSVALMPELDSGQYDLILSFLEPTFTNRQRFAFSSSLYLVGPVLTVQENSSVTSLDQLIGKIVAVDQNLLLRYENRQKRAISLRSYDNIREGFEDLARGRIDGVVTSAPQSYAYTGGFYADRLKVVTPPLNDDGLRIVGFKTPKIEQALPLFNKALKELQEEGIYEALLDKWNLLNPHLRTTERHLHAEQ